MKLIVFIFLAGQLYSSGALFLRKEAPRSCTSNEGEIGACVLYDQCNNDSTIIEDGTGIINLRGLQSTDCPLSTVCCKMPDNHQKDSDHYGDLHRNKPIHSGELHRNQPITSRPETTNYPKTSYSVEYNRKQPKTLSCTTMDGTPGECVQNYQCDIDTNSVIANGDGIINVRIYESTDCPPPTVCCKIPDSQKNSNPQTANSEENYRNQPKTSDQEKNNYPQTLAQEITNHPQTLSCMTMDGTPGECVQNYQCDIDTNSVITNGDGIINVRIDEFTDCPPPTVCCKIPDSQKNSNPQTANSEENYRNQPKTSDQEKNNYPQTLAQEITNHPQTLSCMTMDGTPGECVQNYQCDIDTNSVITNGDGIINVRIDESTDCPPPTVCCKIPYSQKNSNPQTANSEENYRNQPKTSDQEKKNYPQTLAQEITNHPQTLSCTTMDGSPGECVQNYQCDFDTNSVITNGDGIINVRILYESNDCPPPTVCCKIPDSRQKYPQLTNSEENQNQLKTSDQETMDYPQTLSCTTMDGTPGECVLNYQCDIDTNSIISNGDGIIDVRINESTDCPLPTVCCKIPNNNQEDPTHSKELDRNQQKTMDQETMNYPQTLHRKTMNYPQISNKETMNYPQRLDQEIMNYPQTLDQETVNYPQTLNKGTMNYPQTLSCTTMDGTPGECVQNYLCGIETSTSVEEKDSANTNACPISMVCCKIPDISSRSNLPSESALYPYIRVPRDSNRSGCGYRNRNGVNVTGAAFDTAPEYAKPGEFPWTVAIANLKERVGRVVHYNYLGSGALIHERAVLTAAHIFRGQITPTTFMVVIGDYDQNAVNILPRKSIRVQNVEIHNLYDKNLFYDIALVLLQKPVLVSGHVNYICLPPSDYQDPVGTSCISSGWGENGFGEHQYIMNKAEVPVVDHTACQSQLRRVDELGPMFELHSSFMCAGEGGVDSCKGSGGAPLACPMQNEPDKYVLSGVVSWSNNCSLDGIPSVYARVPTVRQWIDDKMAANGYPITS